MARKVHTLSFAPKASQALTAVAEYHGDTLSGIVSQLVLAEAQRLKVGPYTPPPRKLADELRAERRAAQPAMSWGQYRVWHNRNLNQFYTFHVDAMTGELMWGKGVGTSDLFDKDENYVTRGDVDAFLATFPGHNDEWVASNDD